MSIQIVRTLAKTAFMKYRGKYKATREVNLQVDDWVYNQATDRFDIHFTTMYESQFGISFWAEWKKETTQFNLQCDGDGRNAKIKNYSDNKWENIGSLS